MKECIMRRTLFTILLIWSALNVTGCNTKQDSPHGTGHSGTDAKGHMDHGTGQAQPALMVQMKPAVPTAGQPVAFTLMVHDAKGTMVKDFAVVHEQKIHLIIVRDGL